MDVLINNIWVLHPVNTRPGHHLSIYINKYLNLISSLFLSPFQYSNLLSIQFNFIPLVIVIISTCSCHVITTLTVWLRSAPQLSLALCCCCWWWWHFLAKNKNKKMMTAMAVVDISLHLSASVVVCAAVVYYLMVWLTSRVISMLPTGKKVSDLNLHPELVVQSVDLPHKIQHGFLSWRQSSCHDCSFVVVWC